MVIGCVRELVDVSVGGAPVVEEIAPAGEATTDSSVVGNWPVAVPFAFTAGVPGAVGALATTALSVVGNACGTLALGQRRRDRCRCHRRRFFILRQLIGGDVRFLQRCLLIFHLLLQRFHRLGQGFDLLAQRRHIRCGGGGGWCRCLRQSDDEMRPPPTLQCEF